MAHHPNAGPGIPFLYALRRWRFLPRLIGRNRGPRGCIDVCQESRSRRLGVRGWPVLLEPADRGERKGNEFRSLASGGA